MNREVAHPNIAKTKTLKDQTFEQRNTEMLRVVANNLGPIREDVVFLGGTVLPFLLTRPAARMTRRSKDVDFIFDAASREEIYDFEDKLWDLGFVKTLNGAVCRWKINGINIDILPASREIIGFSNYWCYEAWNNPSSYGLEKGESIKIISAPAFLGVKFSAFYRRGHNNYLNSYDIADIFLLLGGRPELKSELLEKASGELSEFLAVEFKKLLNSVKNPVELLPETLIPQLPEVLDCIQKIVTIKKPKTH